MTRKEIEELFKAEDYDKAVSEIKNALRNDSDNGELIYYLFLAENKDYANIDLDNIVNEVNFNRALELSNRRLRNEFEAEYNFYRDSDPEFRKLFCYASRENKEKIYENIEEVNEVRMPENLDEYFDNLDYLVTSRISKATLECNIVVLNLLYILSHEKKIIDLINRLLPIAKEMDFRYNDYHVYDDRYELYDFVGYLNTPIEELEDDDDEDYITDEEIEEGSILANQQNTIDKGEFILDDDDDKEYDDIDEEEDDEEERQAEEDRKKEEEYKALVEKRKQEIIEQSKKENAQAETASNYKKKKKHRYIEPQDDETTPLMKFFIAIMILFIWGVFLYFISKGGARLIRTEGYDWAKYVADYAHSESDSFKSFIVMIGAMLRLVFFMALSGICYALMYAVVPIVAVFGTWYFGMNLLSANRADDFEDRDDWTIIGWKFEHYLLFFMAVPSVLNIWFMWW